MVYTISHTFSNSPFLLFFSYNNIEIPPRAAQLENFSYKNTNFLLTLCVLIYVYPFFLRQDSLHFLSYSSAYSSQTSIPHCSQDIPHKIKTGFAEHLVAWSHSPVFDTMTHIFFCLCDTIISFYLNVCIPNTLILFPSPYVSQTDIHIQFSSEISC